MTASFQTFSLIRTIATTSTCSSSRSRRPRYSTSSHLPPPPHTLSHRPIMKPLSKQPHLRTILISFAFLLLLFPFLVILTNSSPYHFRNLVLSPPPSNISTNITIAIKTYICDSTTTNQLITLLHHLRLLHPTIPILLANDGPISLHSHPPISTDPFITHFHLPLDSGISYGRNALVNRTTTPYFLLLDDDHLPSPDGTLLSRLVHAMHGFDIVGMRVHNLPGIPELEQGSIYIPRYIANITRFAKRRVELCVWDENAGPSVQDMRQAVPMDVLHNALLARTEALRRSPWREELKVNEHMTFFLDAKKNKLRVGYLPSVYVWHRRREQSKCYYEVRDREESFEKLLDYKDDFLWTKGCYKTMVDYVKWHLEVQTVATGSDEGMER